MPRPRGIVISLRAKLEQQSDLGARQIPRLPLITPVPLRVVAIEGLSRSQAYTTVGSHLSKAAFRVWSKWPRIGFRYSLTKRSIFASSLR